MLTYKEYDIALEECYSSEDYSVEKTAELIYNLLKQYNFKAEEKIIPELLDWPIVHEEAHDRGRWNEIMKSIVKLNDHYLRVHWYQGLTEYQDNFYETCMEEVVPHTYEKTVTFTVTEWCEVKTN